MIRNVDLFSLAQSGVNASNSLLQTTSKNIANVNTQGYVRERTTFEGGIVGGVGEGSTERVISVFAQNQLRRDITKVGEFEVLEQKTSALDNLLASEANSLAGGLSEFFAATQTAADDPTNLASRELVLSEGQEMLRRLQTASDFMLSKEQEVNLEFTAMVKQANDLISTIGDLNHSILVAKGSFSAGAEPTTLLNQRDMAIQELASLVSIEVRDGAEKNGSVVVNLTSGESLVMDDGSFNVFELGSNADLDRKELQLATDFSGAKNNTKINIEETRLGGKLGGLFRFRDEVLAPAQRDVGQLALAFADAVNSQNQLGMDLDMQLGGNIFTLPEFTGTNYAGTPGTLPVTGRVTPGLGNELTDADFKITVTATAGGVPSEITVELLNSDGSPKRDASNNPIVYGGLPVVAGFNQLPGGIEVSFDAASGYSEGNEFLIQPTKRAASDIEMATARPEDLAFASPIRIQAGNDNLGEASIVSTRVTNTNLGSQGSAFDGSGGIHGVADSPSPSVGAPAQVVFTSATSYQVLDSETPPNVITNVTGVTSYTNLLAQAQENGAAPSWPTEFAALDDYPGYDFSLKGTPKAGDSFSITYNTNGVADNANALELISLQQEKLVQLSSNNAAEARSFHDAYSSIVGKIGEKAASADTSLQAAEAMREQSSSWFESISGVNLDEEAANLIRFQQSYAAAARILTTAQELFDTILSAAR